MGVYMAPLPGCDGMPFITELGPLLGMPEDDEGARGIGGPPKGGGG